MSTKELLTKRLDDHYAAVNEIDGHSISEKRELTSKEKADRKHHLAQILILKDRIWDEFDAPELMADSRKIIQAGRKQKLLDEIRAFEDKYP
jgi:hypothetical protein